MNNNVEYFSSITEVSKKLDVPAYTLRYWEKQFPTAVKPTTGAGGRRYYRSETVDALTNIRELLYNRGMTIAGVKKLIKDGGLDSMSGTASVSENMQHATMANQPAVKDTSVANAANIDHAVALLGQARELLKKSE